MGAEEKRSPQMIQQLIDDGTDSRKVCPQSICSSDGTNIPHSYRSSVCKMYGLTEQDSGKDNRTESIKLSDLLRPRRGGSRCEPDSDANLKAEFRHFQKRLQKLKNCNN